jgi:hypothetical protein
MKLDVGLRNWPINKWAFIWLKLHTSEEEWVELLKLEPEWLEFI